jgi:hypothetical protein
MRPFCSVVFADICDDAGALADIAAFAVHRSGLEPVCLAFAISTYLIR